MGYLGRSPTPSPIDSSDIPANSIDASKIIDGAIAVADVADNAITEAKIADAAVVSLKSGRKNLIINGDMQVWQRGTSFTSAGYTADRWKWAGGAGTVTQQAFTAGDEIVDSPYYLRWAVTGNSQNYELQHNIEDVRTAAGKSCKLSFWAKSSTGTETLGWEVYQNFGSGGSALTSAGGGTYTPTTSWAKYTFDVTMGSMSGKTIGTGSYIWVRAAQMATTNTPTIEFAGVQLELGSVATDFEHRSYGEELALCQRYYQASNGAIIRNLVPYSTANSYTDHVIFPTTMRTTPSIIISSPQYHSTNGWATAGTAVYRVTGYGFNWEPSGSFTAYAPRLGEFSYTADAEL